tara:strand:- start:65 stop:475 length:411 start_codon:yes stop_codon:yes gene_type:complete
MKNKRKAPVKVCPDCQEQCHARLSSCKDCGFVFYKKKSRFIEDWKSLDIGEYIRVIGRSGDYYIKDSGERIYFTDAGIYKVRRVIKDGLLVVGHGRNAHGFEFLYMGSERKSRLMDSVYNSPHKLAIVSLKRKGES